MLNLIKNSFKLSEFVESAIVANGGLVELVEPDLIEILLPEIIEHNVKKIAFDPDLVEENTDAEFVTFGSEWLEQLITIVSQKGKTCQLYIETLPLSPYQLQKQVMRQITFGNAKWKSYNERVYMFHHIVFNFQMTYISDEKEEENRFVAIDLANGQLTRQLLELIDKSRLSETTYLTYPDYQSIDVLQAYIIARQKIERKLFTVIKEKQTYLQHRKLKEIERISNFYEEGKDEMETNLAKPDLSDEKKNMLENKLKLIEIEKSRRIQELEGKYKLQTFLRLMNAVIISHPKIVLESILEGDSPHHRDGLECDVDIVWNPITQASEPIICEICSFPVMNLWIKYNGDICCENCFRKSPAR